MNAVLEMYDLARLLDVALCREDAPREKPAPELFLTVAANLGVPPAALFGHRGLCARHRRGARGRHAGARVHRLLRPQFVAAGCARLLVELRRFWACRELQALWHVSSSLRA